MKMTKKLLCAVLVVVMLITSVIVSGFSASADYENLAKYYSTNPSGKVGVKKTITIDGKADDWSEDMIIAQSAAWDVPNHWKGGHENCVLDTYALFAAWDDSNLYVGWQMVNTTDTWADREGDGPLSDGGRVLDVPLVLALSVDPSTPAMTNLNDNGGSIWGQHSGFAFSNHTDHLFYMSGKPGLGEPAMFTAGDSKGNTNYTTACKLFKNAGIEYKMAETNICKEIWGLNGSNSPKDVNDDGADWVDFKTYKGGKRAHKISYDSFYEIKIPLTNLGIDSSYITKNGIGAMLVATRGESAIDCIPFDDVMLDNALKSYSKDASTSMEKEDDDLIGAPLARIGKSSGGTTPTPGKPTEAPTEELTTAPVTETETPTETVTETEQPTTTGPRYELGDVNRDGTLSIKDATEIQKQVALLTQFDAEQTSLADFNSDGYVNVKDATAIQKKLAKLD